MSESKFTRGPWSVRPFVNAIDVVDRDGIPVAHISDRRIDSDGLPPANAKLIAAAPELFSALQEMEAMYSHAWDVVDGGLLMTEKSVKRFDAACEQARIAIAKATGASP